MSDIFHVPARRCKRCGGILTSEQGLKDGYGSCCKKKMEEEAADARMRKIQISLFEKRRGKSEEEVQSDSSGAG